MKKFYFTLLFLVASLHAFSTAQSGDIIIFQKDTLALFTNPLEQYFETKNERTINGEEITWKSTDCYRGYQAIWKIENDCLYLIEIRKGCHTKETYKLQQEFKEDIILADWFSGELLIPSGKMIHYEHSGYISLYEYETILEIQGGNLYAQKRYDNSKSYQSIFHGNIDSLRQFINENIDWEEIEPLDKTETVVTRIKSGTDKFSFEVYLIKKSENESLNQQVLKILSKLPEWDVYYKKGKPHNIEWTVPITFTEGKRKK